MHGTEKGGAETKHQGGCRKTDHTVNCTPDSDTNTHLDEFSVELLASISFTSFKTWVAGWKFLAIFCSRAVVVPCLNKPKARFRKPCSRQASTAPENSTDTGYLCCTSVTIITLKINMVKQVLHFLVGGPSLTRHAVSGLCKIIIII